MADTIDTQTALLNASGVGSANYTSVLMLPANGPRQVFGGGAGSPLIDLNGAKNVRIDGYGQLTLYNQDPSASAGTSTIRFIGGAQNNIVANCTISGASTVPVGGVSGTNNGGTILFSTTTANGTNIVGNNNNIIANNDIGPAGTFLPTKAICGLGTAGNNTRNQNNVITNNNIFDFFNATGAAAASTTGIDIRGGNHNWTISNNRLYQTATRTFTGVAGQRYAGITISGTTGANGDAHTITGNVIGFGFFGFGTTTITGTGTGAQNEVRGIDFQGGSSGTATSIQGNVVSGINVTSARAATTTCNASFAGIQACTLAGASATGTLDIGNLTGNAVGSLDGSSTIVINATSTTANTAPVFGILGLSSQSNNISNNRIGAITIQGTGTVTGFRGIFPGATAATTQTINNNTIGGAVAGGAITDTQVGSYAMYAMQTSTAAVSINGNLIQNINGNSNAAGLIVGSGLEIASASTSAASTISRNTIHSLSNNSGTASNSIYAIDLTMPTNVNVTGNLIERNFVHSISLTSTDTTSQIFGIVMRGQGTATIQNNMIQLGLDKDGNSITGGYSFVGIRDISGSARADYYYNSVYIGGTGLFRRVQYLRLFQRCCDERAQFPGQPFLERA